MNLTDRRQRFRAILEGDRCVHPGSVFDPISARIAEDLGFEVGMFAGSIASGTVLGAPDLIVLTLTEFAQQIHRICRAGNLSLLVDADHGYGNALNVRRTVEELETAGVSCLTIEDTVLPVSFGGAGEGQLISLEEGVGKMKAALSARQDPTPQHGAGDPQKIPQVQIIQEGVILSQYVLTQQRLDGAGPIPQVQKGGPSHGPKGNDAPGHGQLPGIGISFFPLLPSLELGDSGGGSRDRLVPGRIGVDTPLAEAFQFGLAAG